MEFCPACGMMLQIDPATGSHRLRLFCPTCPYVCPIQNKIVKKARLVKKEVEPIFSGKDAMQFAAKTSGDLYAQHATMEKHTSGRCRFGQLMSQ
ncbi:hypothetical protein ACP70R_027579 [Stipagrostis hirtigluma subsp. patula]